MQIAIWGAGAVGLGLASALAREGEPIRVLGRDPETLEALAADGLRRIGLFGERRVPAAWLAPSDDPATLGEARPDWLLVCAKTTANPALAARLAPLAPTLAPRTRLVLCQNGWGNERAFASFWPSERLLHARIITGFHRRRPNEVEVTAHAAPIAIGRLDDPTNAPDPVAAPLAERLAAGGLPAVACGDLRGVLWAKMLYNCALNPLGALAGRRYGDLTADPTTKRLVDRVVHEIFDVLRAAGTPLPWPDAAAYLAHFHTELIPPTAAHESSMLQDLRAGRRTEIDALCGAVEGLGAEHGVETPVVSALATLVRAAEGAA